MVGPFDDVLIPRGSTKTDWEVELGVVIGTTARYLDSPDEALGHVAGYAVSHDVSEREFQLERGGQWDKGKSCETFNPFGPDLVPADAGRRPAGARAAALGQRRAAAGRLDRQHDLLGRARDLVPAASSWCCTRATSSTRARRPASRSASPARPTCARATSVELEIDGLGRASQRMVQA